VGHLYPRLPGSRQWSVDSRIVQRSVFPSNAFAIPARSNSAPTTFVSKSTLCATSISADETASENSTSTGCKSTPSANARFVVIP